MLEIKTIIKPNENQFDITVNAAIAEGWVLLRRECFITGSDRATTFYAELEREIEEPEVEEEPMGDDEAEWEICRNPHTPYRCSNCGYTAKTPWPHCPECKKRMVW